MDEDWDGIADWYAALVRGGSAMHEFSRDVLLSEVPANLAGSDALDIGCGEGLVTRALATRGAAAIGIDPTAIMIAHARNAEHTNPVEARYRIDDGSSLHTIADGSIDWVTAARSMNNVPDLASAITAIKGVLQSDGHLVFTIPHPCFEAPQSTWARVNGSTRRLVGDYRAEGFWRSHDAASVRRAGGQLPPHHLDLPRSPAHSPFSARCGRGARADFRCCPTNPHHANLPPFLLVYAVSID